MTTTKRAQKIIETVKAVPRPSDRSNIWDCVTLLTMVLDDTLVLLEEKDQQICGLKMGIERLDGKLDGGSQI